MSNGLVAQTTSASLEKHTGRTWDQWIALLNKSGAHLLLRKDIVALLKTKYKLSPWWQQIVASGYEQKTGRRIEGQNLKGLYSVTGVKTLSIGHAKVWKHLVSDDGLALWLRPLSPVDLKANEAFETDDGWVGEIRVVKKGKQIRFRLQDDDWEKPSVCVLAVHPRPNGKTMITISHTDLPTTRVKESMRTHWKQVLEQLQEFMKS